jgi:hypothetical protein
MLQSCKACKISQFATANATRMRHPGKHHPKPEPGESRDHPDESLRRLRSRFSRRLESFGLGETQSPLLTDNVDSVDAEGNAR